MKVILTHAYFLNEDPKEQAIMRPYPPLGILYISAFLKENGYDPIVVDSTFLSPDEWRQEIINHQPDVVAFYVNLMTKMNILAQLSELKSSLPKTIFVGGGPDVTYNQKDYLLAGFDSLVIGEGEQSMLELIQHVEQHKLLAQIPGVTILQNGQPSELIEREKLKSLASLPFPDREAIPMENYLSCWKVHHGKRTLNVSTQRGCPYTCKWCSTAVFGQSYRRNSPQRVVEELMVLRRDLDVEAIWFVDDVFTVSHKWIGELHEEFQKHNFIIPFECITRAERLNDTVLNQLKEMGCFRIWIGAESGSQKIIDAMDRRVTLEQVQTMMQLTRSKGMETGTFIMVGYPGETDDDIRATLDHIRKCNPHYLTITRAYPIKGTDLYSEIESQISTPLNWTQQTDRDLEFQLPYSNNYYKHAIRFLVNGWKAESEGKLNYKIKRNISSQWMRWTK